MARKRGFTLIELLVVIIIVCLLAGMVVALLNMILRDQGARQGAQQVVAAFAQAKQRAADLRKVHFVVFVNEETAGKYLESGRIEIHVDADRDKQYDGDAIATTSDADPLVKGSVVRLPRQVYFTTAPVWVGVHPTGFCTFDAGFSEISAGSFDSAEQGGTLPSGDVIVGIPKDAMTIDSSQNKMSFCLDIDRASGKIRRGFFLNQSN